MERIDPNMEAEVWQRVMGQREQPVREDIRPLLLSAMEAVSAYRHLSGMLTGKGKERMKGLHQGAMASVSCLKGIQAMSGGGSGKLTAMPIPKEPVRKTLEKSYHRTRHLMAEYTGRSLDPEFGVLYQRMADREREHGVVLAEILGELGR